MRVSEERTWRSSHQTHLVDGVQGSSGAVRRPDKAAVTPREEVAEAQPAELIYDELVSHAMRCATCWPWRNQLWAVHRLCWQGAALADRYAVAEAMRGGAR